MLIIRQGQRLYRREDMESRCKEGHFSEEEYQGINCPYDNIQKNYAQNTSYSVIVNDAKNNYEGQLIADFVEKVRNNKESPAIIEVCPIKERERKCIEKLTGEVLNATKHTLHKDELVHIENRHGRNGKHDSSMSDIEAYEHIPDIIHNFDSLDYVYENGKIVRAHRYKNKKGEQAPLIRYVKSIDNYTCYVVEAVTDCKRGDVSIISAYRAKKEST